MRICPRCSGSGGTEGAPCHHCKGLGYVKDRTFGGDPRCRCGLIATFPAHDYEMDKLKVALGKVMEERDAARGNLRVAMASNKILQHDIEALQDDMRENWMRRPLPYTKAGGALP